MKSPNWNDDELILALELYMSKSLEWLARMTDSTEEVVGLSKLLNELDFHDAAKYKNFRSVGSIRMKLTNFKTLDPNYKKTLLSNISNQDRMIWNKYYGNMNLLKRECNRIISEHLPVEHSAIVSKYIEKYNCDNEGILKEFDYFLTSTYENAIEFQIKLNGIENQSVYDRCQYFIKTLEFIGAKRRVDDDLEYKEHAGINQVPVDNKENKIGKYVQNCIEKLIAEQRITSKLLDDLLSADWSRRVLHLGKPFFIEIDTSREVAQQVKDVNGYVRYWKKLYSINGKTYCVCKEWYENQRKYFEQWIESVEKNSTIDISEQQLSMLLNLVCENDRKYVNVKRSDLYDVLKEVDNKEDIIIQLINLGVLVPFQGVENELIVEDYDLLYDMLENTHKYIR